MNEPPFPRFDSPVYLGPSEMAQLASESDRLRKQVAEESRCTSLEADRDKARDLAAEAHLHFAEQRQRAEIAERDLAEQRRENAKLREALTALADCYFIRRGEGMLELMRHADRLLTKSE